MIAYFIPRQLILLNFTKCKHKHNFFIVCCVSAGISAILQPDHHAATDVGVLQTAPSERRWGECPCLHSFVYLYISGYICSGEMTIIYSPLLEIDLCGLIWIRLFAALSLCNLWKNPGFFHLVTWLPCSTMWALFLSGCNITELHGMAAWHLAFL